MCLRVWHPRPEGALGRDKGVGRIGVEGGSFNGGGLFRRLRFLPGTLAAGQADQAAGRQDEQFVAKMLRVFGFRIAKVAILSLASEKNCEKKSCGKKRNRTLPAQ